MRRQRAELDGHLRGGGTGEEGGEGGERELLHGLLLRVAAACGSTGRGRRRGRGGARARRCASTFSSRCGLVGGGVGAQHLLEEAGEGVAVLRLHEHPLGVRDVRPQLLILGERERPLVVLLRLLEPAPLARRSAPDRARGSTRGAPPPPQASSSASARSIMAIGTGQLGDERHVPLGVGDGERPGGGGPVEERDVLLVVERGGAPSRARRRAASLAEIPSSRSSRPRRP